MEQKLSKSADSVQKIIHELDLECQVLELPSSTRTAADAASSIGCKVTQIVKSLIFRTKKTNKPVLVLASGPNKVNEKKLSLQLGEAIVKGDANYAKQITGFAIGGIPPIGHKINIEHIYIDQDLTALPDVWAAAGTPNAVFRIKSKALLQITHGEVTCIT